MNFYAYNRLYFDLLGLTLYRQPYGDHLEDEKNEIM